MHVRFSVMPEKLNVNIGQKGDSAQLVSIEGLHSQDIFCVVIMPVPFGFSVGDFIGSIELLVDAVKSLRDNGAQDDYKKLSRELKHLRTGLECIEALSLEHNQPVQFSAAKAAVDDCFLCLDGFIQRNAKFSSLGSIPASRRTAVGFKDRWRMVQWALWKKADIAKFNSEVQKYAEAIQMLLATIQMRAPSP